MRSCSTVVKLLHIGTLAGQVILSESAPRAAYERLLSGRRARGGPVRCTPQRALGPGEPSSESPF
jgi:hypothetical protein